MFLKLDDPDSFLLSFLWPPICSPKGRLGNRATRQRFAVGQIYICYFPVPVNATFCGLPAALSVMLMAALRAPVAVGLNLTLIAQLADTAREVPQVLV